MKSGVTCLVAAIPRAATVCCLAVSTLAGAGPVGEVIGSHSGKSGHVDAWKADTSLGIRADQGVVDVDAELAEIARVKKLMQDLGRMHGSGQPALPGSGQQPARTAGEQRQAGPGVPHGDPRAAMGTAAMPQAAEMARAMLGDPTKLAVGQPGARPDGSATQSDDGATPGATAPGKPQPGAYGHASGADLPRVAGNYSRQDVEIFRSSLETFIDDMKPWAWGLAAVLLLSYALRFWLSRRAALARRQGHRGMGRRARRRGSRARDAVYKESGAPELR